MLLAFVVFALLKSIFILVEYTGPDSGGMETARTLHLVAYQGLANVPFTMGATLAVACLLDRVPARSWRLAIGAAIAAAVGFGLLLIEAQTIPPLSLEAVQ